MQLTLSFLKEMDPPQQEQPLLPHWDEIDPDAQKACIQTLARAISQMIYPNAHQKIQEVSHDR